MIHKPELCPAKNHLHTSPDHPYSGSVPKTAMSHITSLTHPASSRLQALQWHCCLVGALIAVPPLLKAQLVISGNENKINLTSGAAQVVDGAGPDSISILNFSTWPPTVQHLDNVPNTVLGPPSNIAITPDRSLALIANSIKLDSSAAAKWVPNNEIHLLDLTENPPRITGQVQAGLQPSGMSISRDGKFALVANRAQGTVTLLTIDKKAGVRAVDSVRVCTAEESVSDVAISPDGKLALASAQKGGFLAVLSIEKNQVKFTGRKISVYGQPYRTLITPDGQLGITAGIGYGNAVDSDAISIVDLRGGQQKTIDHIPIGSGPESMELSPNGQLLVAVVMNGSNLAPDHRDLTRNGLLEVLVRRGTTFEKSDSIPIGPIPEGVAFTSDGKHLVVQSHSTRNLWILRVYGNSIRDTGHRIKVPGMPSSLRASP